VYVKFEYSAEDNEAGLQAIEKDLREEILRKGGVPNWIGVGRGNIWLVKGTLWREVCFNRNKSHSAFMIISPRI
jgi:hypothetical protein